jgi:hypothetical protein
MSAVELANGVLFGQGPAARYLTALNRPAAPVTGKLLGVERSVDHALRASPPLAAAFARNIQSGNRIQVRAALTALGTLAQTAYVHQYGAAVTRQMMTQEQTAIENAVPKTPGNGISADSGTVSTEFFAVAFYVAAIVAAVVVFFGVFTAMHGPSGKLAEEQIVNLVAVGLHHAAA